MAYSQKFICICLCFMLASSGIFVEAGHGMMSGLFGGGKHGGNSGLETLLAAGILAKLLRHAKHHGHHGHGHGHAHALSAAPVHAYSAPVHGFSAPVHGRHPLIGAEFVHPQVVDFHPYAHLYEQGQEVVA